MSHRNRRFSEDEVDEIFRLAIGRSLERHQELTERDLLAIGEELDVAAEDLTVAMDTVAGSRNQPHNRTGGGGVQGAGGTAGGIGTFFLGLIMSIAGGYLITQNVTIHMGYFGHVYGYSSFGLTLIPVIFGIGFLFFNGKSIIGWLLSGAGIVVIFMGIIMNLRIGWRPTSLYELLVMIVLFVGGLGLIARSLLPMGTKE